MDDKKIKADLLMRIRRDSRINEATIDVNVNNGLVILRGKVTSFKKKLALQVKAKKTRGVISVENRVKVVYPYEHGNPPVGIIKETAENVLQANSDIDKTKIQVSVDSGIVTLRGTVQWYWQLQRAEELLANIIGVVDISNELIVVPSENITDEKIAEQIVDELADSDLVNLDQLLIKVEKGIVFLSGTVKGYAAECEVYDATIQQPGVKQVQNNILVAMTDQ